MKTRAWILSVWMVAAASTARGGEVCETIQDCRTLMAKVQERLAALGLTDLVRDADGNIRPMSLAEAEEYCRLVGQRLPTARELAIHAQSQGVQGISEIAKEGYELIDVYPEEHSPRVTRFYFSFEGYWPPVGGQEKVYVLSSSRNAARPAYAYVLDGRTGRLVGDLIGSRHAVRCMRPY